VSEWLNRCHFGDCREVMAAWPAGVADACITDPPYGDTSLEWDRQVDGWIPAVARVLKPAASLWVFGSMRFLAPLFAQMEAAGFRYSQDIVWEKQNGTGFHADRFRRVHEHAVMFYRGAGATCTTIRRSRWTPRPRPCGAKPARHIPATSRAGHYVSEDGGPRLMRSVIAVKNEHGTAVHPTQKPLGILAR
jgi:site-specific DNA-methyltransferase (adenine-specific)